MKNNRMFMNNLNLINSFPVISVIATFISSIRLWNNRSVSLKSNNESKVDFNQITPQQSNLEIKNDWKLSVKKLIYSSEAKELDNYFALKNHLKSVFDDYSEAAFPAMIEWTAKNWGDCNFCTHISDKFILEFQNFKLQGNKDYKHFISNYFKELLAKNDIKTLNPDFSLFYPPASSSNYKLEKKHWKENIKCAGFAFQMLQETSLIDKQLVVHNSIEALLKAGYQVVDTPENNDLVLYGHFEQLNDIKDIQINHYGVWKEGKVISKWGGLSFYEHDLANTFPSYGTSVLFFRKNVQTR